MRNLHRTPIIFSSKRSTFKDLLIRFQYQMINYQTSSVSHIDIEYKLIDDTVKDWKSLMKRPLVW